MQHGVIVTKTRCPNSSEEQELMSRVSYVYTIRSIIFVMICTRPENMLLKCLCMKDLGDTTYILVVKMYRDRSKRLIGLSQSTYLDKILKKFKMQDSKKGLVPMQHGLTLRKTWRPNTNEELESISRVTYFYYSRVPYASEKKKYVDDLSSL